ncbi:hypothetical protein [Novosphingobium sp. P6W]|uniref:hypothetical protein n=1 Tax=Novosphingobium sp. P6W TaxID=1609758 RepID=UPI0005C3029D|nr:hypothetical protein [Novosphingobium sp. P6W]AXB78659.1 hypothetical protein TQ38_018765 [Novosphingobium sp. P6W]KIS30030.1 hypothetical protein TQ38_25075 [Novosphingobium sp. P6W]
MKVVAFASLALLAIAGCGQRASAPDEEAQGPKLAAETPRPSTAPAAQPSVAPAEDLTPYIGKYPFDVVAGHRFLDNPAVKAAIAAAVPDAKVRAVVRYKDGELGIPIKRVKGGRLLIWGGENHAEDYRNWSVVLAPDGSEPEVCIYDGLGYDEDFQSSQWFEPGAPSIMKQGKCPSDGEDYPAPPIAAG